MDNQRLDILLELEPVHAARSDEESADRLDHEVAVLNRPVQQSRDILGRMIEIRLNLPRLAVPNDGKRTHRGPHAGA